MLVEIPKARHYIVRCNIFLWFHVATHGGCRPPLHSAKRFLPKPDFRPRLLARPFFHLETL